jgi:hypothetical protein
LIEIALLWLIPSHWNLDLALWLQYISFAIVFVVAGVSVRGLVLQISRFVDAIKRLTSSSSSSSSSSSQPSLAITSSAVLPMSSTSSQLLILFFTEFMGVYIVASLLSMRMGLPPAYRQIITYGHFCGKSSDDLAM